MDNYDLQRAVRPFVAFIEDLTNWYIRRSRRRFWKSEDDGDKQHAYATLYHALIELCKIAAPFTPFIAEEIYRNLRTDDMPESVHLCDFPTAAGAKRDMALETQMRIVMDVVSMGRQLRKDHDAKVRQPLRRLDVVSRDSGLLNQVGELKTIIAEELNVREVTFGDDETALAELKAKANFKTLGRKFGKQVQQINQAVQKLSVDELKIAAAGKGLVLQVGGETIELAGEDIVVERIPKAGLAVQAQGALIVALDLELDADLIREGIARELVNNVQQMRKANGFEVTDRIHLKLSSDEAVCAAVAAYTDYIQSEVLALSVQMAETEGEAVDLNGHTCTLSITKA
jgi:isoleucyl-tRNA synthetase